MTTLTRTPTQCIASNKPMVIAARNAACPVCGALVAITPAGRLAAHEGRT